VSKKLSDRPDWDGLKSDVNKRIDALSVVWENVQDTEIGDRIRSDLCLPALRLLVEFCMCVEIDEDVEVESE